MESELNVRSENNMLTIKNCKEVMNKEMLIGAE